MHIKCTDGRAWTRKDFSLVDMPATGDKIVFFHPLPKNTITVTPRGKKTREMQFGTLVTLPAKEEAVKKLTDQEFVVPPWLIVTGVPQSAWNLDLRPRLEQRREVEKQMVR